MTTYRVEISDPFLLAERLDKLQADWPGIAEQAMKDALVSSKYLQEAWRRTPKSNRARYASAYAGVELRIRKKGDPNNPSQWEASLPSDWRKRAVEYHVKKATQSGRERFTGPTMRGMDQIDRYGLGRLSNSILPRQDGSVFQVSRTSSSVTLSLSTSLEYAARVHEAKKPIEGDYWTPGKDHGWSAYGTGNKFLEKPYRDLQDKIAKRFAANVDRELERRGLK